MATNQQETPMFDFFSGGIKGLIEAIIFKIIGVEVNAKIAHKNSKK